MPRARLRVARQGRLLGLGLRRAVRGGRRSGVRARRTGSLRRPGSTCTESLVRSRSPRRSATSSRIGARAGPPALRWCPGSRHALLACAPRSSRSTASASQRVYDVPPPRRAGLTETLCLVNWAPSSARDRLGRWRSHGWPVPRSWHPRRRGRRRTRPRVDHQHATLGEAVLDRHRRRRPAAHPLASHQRRPRPRSPHSRRRRWRTGRRERGGPHGRGHHPLHHLTLGSRRDASAMTLSPGLRKFALATHLTLSVGWIGAVAAYMALDVAAATSEDAQVLRAAYLMMESIARYVIVPLAFAALLTGLVMSLGTSWGLFRHYWVLISFLLTLVATTVLLVETRVISSLAEMAADPTTSTEDL